MKNLLSALLLGTTLALLAPGADALDHGKSRGGVRVSGYRGSSHELYSSRGRSRGYESSRVWVPGCYETVSQRVWVPGCSRRVWVEPRFELRIGSCGERFRVQIGGGHWKVVYDRGHYETREVRVWREGHWVARGSHR